MPRARNLALAGAETVRVLICEHCEPTYARYLHSRARQARAGGALTGSAARAGGECAGAGAMLGAGSAGPATFLAPNLNLKPPGGAAAATGGEASVAMVG